MKTISAEKKILTRCRLTRSRSRPTPLLEAMKQIGPGLILAASIVGHGRADQHDEPGGEGGVQPALADPAELRDQGVRAGRARPVRDHARQDDAGGVRHAARPAAGGVVDLLALAVHDCWPRRRRSPRWRGPSARPRTWRSRAPRDAMAAARRPDRPGVGTFLSTREEYFWASLTTLAAVAAPALRRLPAARADDDGPGRGGDAVHGRQRRRSCSGRRSGSALANLESGFTLAVPDGGGGAGVLGVRDHRASGRRSCSPIPTGASRRATPAHAGPRTEDEDWARRARGWTRVMQLDAWFSMVVFTVATVAFYLLGAAVLHPQGLDPKGTEMIPTLSRMYLQPLEGTPLAGLCGPRRGSASCSGPGPSCSRRCTSPPPPTAG